MISHMTFTGIDTPILAQKMIENVNTFVNCFENLQKLCFEGEDTYLLYQHISFTQTSLRDLFVSALTQLSNKCKTLKHVEFVDTLYSIHSNDVESKDARNFLEKFQKIKKVTLNSVCNGEKLEHN